MKKSRKRTLIVARRALTEPKAVLAGVTLEVFPAAPKASTAVFNAEMAPSLSFGRWDLASMVGIRDSWERAVRVEGCEEGPEP